MPIRTRLTLTYCAIFFCSLLLVEGLAYWTVPAAVNSVVDSEMKSRAEGIEDYLVRHRHKLGEKELVSAFENRPAFHPDHLFIADRRTGELFRGTAMRGRTFAFPHGAQQIYTERSAGQAMRLMQQGRKLGEDEYLIVLGSDLRLPAAAMDRLWLLLIGTSPLLLGLAGLSGYWMSKRALQPVARLIQAASKIDSTNLSRRLEVPRTHDEIERLARTMNGMLDRIERGFQQICDFTANASHELRTPLAIIRTTAEVELLRSPGSLPGSQEALRKVVREAERNSVLLEEMLRLSRLEAGAESVHLEEVDLRWITREAVDTMEPLAQERGVILEWSGSKAECLVKVDEEQIRRLCLILLDNALKYTPAGKRVEMAVEARDGRVEFLVRDEGPGIAADQLPHLFERFWRADASRSSTTPGGGLGLAIARQILQLNRGSIAIDSVLGQGACFRVTFPQHQMRKSPEREVPAQTVS